MLNAFDGRFTGSLTVTVTIADVNEPPVVSGEVLVDFTENGTGTVEMYSAMDPDVGATQDWSLAGADGGDFEITNGVLTFINPPDYDMPTDDSRPYNEYLVTVQVNDGANTATRPVTVRVLDVNEAPTVSGNATPSVDENTTAVATYRATDPDERATITWSVEDPGASDFTITNAGALSFASAPNYEVKSSYTVTVRASDGTNDVPHDVTVTVTDVDEREVLVRSPTGHRSLAKSSPLRSKKGRATTWITCSRQPGRGRARRWAAAAAGCQSPTPRTPRTNPPATTANATSA